MYRSHSADSVARRVFLILGAMAFAAGLGKAGETDSAAWKAPAVRHLLSRTSFGGSPETVARLAGLPRDKVIDMLLDDATRAPLPTRPAWVRDVWINRGRRYSDMSREEYLIVLRENTARKTDELNNLRAWWLQEMIKTRAPFRESMVLFWHGHFTSSYTAVREPQALYQQNALFRDHALGNFRTLLGKVTRDPAMMIYLDLEESNKAKPNENYARELMELFTLGVGNYTEKDVKEVARALTGWTLDAPEGSVKIKRPTAAESLQFRSIVRDGLVARFVPEQHDDGEKTVLGESGRFDTDEVLDCIVKHPACGRYLASRLIAYYGADDPEGRLRERMAEAFRESKYEIRPMLKILLTAPEFYSAASRSNQVKGPVRLLVGACRDLELEGEATPSLALFTATLGQELFNPPTVKGWTSGTSWINASTLTLRYRLSETLLDGRELTGAEPLGRPRGMVVPRDPEQARARIKRLADIDSERKQQETEGGLKLRLEPRKLFPRGIPESPEAIVDALLERMVASPVCATTRNALAEAARRDPQGRTRGPRHSPDPRLARIPDRLICSRFRELQHQLWRNQP